MLDLNKADIERIKCANNIVFFSGAFLAVEAHLAGHDEGLGFLAGFGETAVDHQTVQPGLHDLRRTIRSASSCKRRARSPNGPRTAWARAPSSCAMCREVSRP